ncbi:hypothetical protein XELAEV_18035031mg [Xenopus laevis]|uniref:Uncharacterized protein n=1 Tax=Xenopus laevis TaxID=8355 RepID=A0A974CF54_XENLA|nr:hypothetical protein XELAEV_18035031mg [Xenopus laevis]
MGPAAAHTRIQQQQFSHAGSSSSSPTLECWNGVAVYFTSVAAVCTRDLQPSSVIWRYLFFFFSGTLHVHVLNMSSFRSTKILGGPGVAAAT